MSQRPVVALVILMMAIGVVACGGEASVAALALGEEAKVQHADTTAGSAPTALGVTVLAVREGTMEELEAFFEIDEENRGKTPFYVDARYENEGDQTISRELRTSLEDQDGDLIQAVVIFNYGGQPFEACTDNTEGELAPGESFESCTLYLVPEGSTPTRASFLPYVPGEETDWVYWAVA